MRWNKTLGSKAALPLLSRGRLVALAVDGLLVWQITRTFSSVGSFLLTFYFIWGMRSGTLGQRLGRIAVVRDDGARLRRRESFVRGLPWHAILMGSAFPVWGDSLAEILVGALALSEVWLHLKEGYRYGLAELMGGTRTVLMTQEAEEAVPPASATA